jgi:hypothetical protein
MLLQVMLNFTLFGHWWIFISGQTSTASVAAVRHFVSKTISDNAVQIHSFSRRLINMGVYQSLEVPANKKQ